jgi:carbon storage regulator CsrA
MLQLSRRASQAVYIHCPDGTRIEIQVIKIERSGSGAVVLGFTAPHSYVIVREEVKVKRGVRDVPPTIEEAD